VEPGFAVRRGVQAGLGATGSARKAQGRHQRVRGSIRLVPGKRCEGPRAMTLMTNHRVRHLIVIGNGQLGIVSIGDVVKYRLEDLEAESNVLRDAYIAAQ
jgi:hypothetical protein